MRSIILFALLLFILNGVGNSQSVSFDIATFNPPVGWAKDDKGNLLSYTFTNNTRGTYCVLGIYKSIESSGDTEKDFSSDWNNLVGQKLGITRPPQVQKGKPKDGYDVISGAGTFAQGNSSGLAVLTTFTDKRKVMSLVLLTNDTTYFSDFRSFCKSFRPEGLAVSINSSVQSGMENSKSLLFGDYIFTPPPGWKSETRTDGVIISGPDNSSTITILPMIASSGSLEDEMERIFWQVFPGWEADAQNPDHHIYTKGFSPTGWAY